STSPDAGIHVTTNSGQVKVSISDTKIQNCSIGVSLEDSVVASIHDTVIQGKGGGIGIRVATTASGGATVANLDGVTVSHVGQGIRVTTGAAAVAAFLSNSSFFNCSTGSNAGAGVTVTSFGNNKFSNNGLDVSGPFTTKAQQ